MAARSAEFSTNTKPITIEQVQKAIPARAALIEIISYRPYDLKMMQQTTEARYAAYVLMPRGQPKFVDLGEASPIDKAIAQFRVALSDPKRTDVKQLARKLDALTMQPVRGLLGATRWLFISPDGALNLVPFAALVDERNHYLVENFTINYLTSGRDLLRVGAQSEVPSRQPPLVVANPAFDALLASPTSSGPPTTVRSGSLDELRWPELPGTAAEALALKNILPYAQLLTGTQATEASLKTVTAPRLLHLATHGFFLPVEPNAKDSVQSNQNPLVRSGLILAGANNKQSGAGDDGILTALEVAGLDLWGTRLVVLSACETGVGEVRNGEGVFGLRRALVLAGAQSELMSLWKVSDAATRDLMVAYFRYLQTGVSRSEALRRVQLQMLMSSRGISDGRLIMSRRQRLQMRGASQSRSHPFYWASFIPVGDWRSLTLK